MVIIKKHYIVKNYNNVYINTTHCILDTYKFIVMVEKMHPRKRKQVDPVSTAVRKKSKKVLEDAVMREDAVVRKREVVVLAQEDAVVGEDAIVTKKAVASKESVLPEDTIVGKREIVCIGCMVIDIAIYPGVV